MTNPLRRRSRPRAGAIPLILAVLVAAAFLAGVLCHANDWPPAPQLARLVERIRGRDADGGGAVDRPPGRWRAVPAVPSNTGGTGASEDDPEKLLEDLRGVGYLTGYEPSQGFEGVTVRAPSAWPGLNLYTSGHAQAAFLMDMDGRTLHRWSSEFEQVFPDANPPPGVPYTQYWRRVHLYPNGDLLAIYEGVGMLKVDRDSNVLWVTDRGQHHDLQVAPDGRIWVLSRRAHMVERIHPEKPILEDFVSVYEPDGSEVRHVSILEAFERSRYASLLDRMPEHGDLLHTNTIEVLDGSHADLAPAFRRGNVLISALKIDAIAIVDPDSEEVVWALTGAWKAQHQPTFLESGRMLVFDNQGHGGMSKVIELDPLTQEIAWAYEGTPENRFFTAACGSCQRLPNDNTLITESDSGRAFELDAEGNIVWEYYNPARAGDERELVATLFEVVRIDPALVGSWLEIPDDDGAPDESD